MKAQKERTNTVVSRNSSGQPVHPWPWVTELSPALPQVSCETAGWTGSQRRSWWLLRGSTYVWGQKSHIRDILTKTLKTAYTHTQKETRKEQTGGEAERREWNRLCVCHILSMTFICSVFFLPIQLFVLNPGELVCNFWAPFFCLSKWTLCIWVCSNRVNTFFGQV